MRSSSVPRLNSIMVFFAKGATPGAWYRERLTDGQTVANLIAPLPHFVRRGTKSTFCQLVNRLFQPQL